MAVDNITLVILLNSQTTSAHYKVNHSPHKGLQQIITHNFLEQLKANLSCQPSALHLMDFHLMLQILSSDRMYPLMACHLTIRMSRPLTTLQLHPMFQDRHLILLQLILQCNHLILCLLTLQAKHLIIWPLILLFRLLILCPLMLQTLKLDKLLHIVLKICNLDKTRTMPQVHHMKFLNLHRSNTAPIL